MMAAVHLIFTLVSSDPADGVRYALPVQIATAFLVAVALGAGASATPWRRTALFGVVALVAAISIRYTLPVLTARRATETRVSPPGSAAFMLPERSSSSSTERSAVLQVCAAASDNQNATTKPINGPSSFLPMAPVLRIA